jgi:hypothetical protein
MLGYDTFGMELEGDEEGNFTYSWNSARATSSGIITIKATDLRRTQFYKELKLEIYVKLRRPPVILDAILNTDDRCIASITFQLNLQHCNIHSDILYYTTSFNELELSILSSNPDISSSISISSGIFTYINPIEQLNQSVTLQACHVFGCMTNTYTFTCHAFLTILPISQTIAYPGIVYSTTVVIQSNGVPVPYSTFSGIWLENQKPETMTINASTGEIYWLPSRDEELRIISLRVVAQIDNNSVRTVYYEYEIDLRFRHWPLFYTPMPKDEDKVCIIDSESSDCRYDIQEMFDTYSHYGDEFRYSLTSIPSHPDIYYLENNSVLVWKRTQLTNASNEEKEAPSSVLYLEAKDSLDATIYSEGFVIYPNWIPSIGDLEVPILDMEKYTAYKNIPWSRTFTITDGPRIWPESPSYFTLYNIIPSITESQVITLSDDALHWTPSINLPEGSNVLITIQYTDKGIPAQTVNRKFIITVYNDALPVCRTIPDSARLVRVNEEYRINLNDCKIYIDCSDSDSDFIEYTLIKFPSGMIQNNNIITWTPDNSQLTQIYTVQLQLRERIKNGYISLSFILRPKSAICIEISSTLAYAYIPYYSLLSVCEGTTTVSIEYLTYDITSPTPDIQISKEGVISWPSPFILNPTNTPNSNEVSITIRIHENHIGYGYVYDSISVTYVINVDISKVRPTFLDTLPLETFEKFADEDEIYEKDIVCKHPAYTLKNLVNVDMNETPGMTYVQDDSDCNRCVGEISWDIPHLRNSNLTTVHCTSTNNQFITYSLLIYPVTLNDSPPVARQPENKTPFLVTEGQTSSMQIYINDVDTPLANLLLEKDEDLAPYSNLVLYKYGFIEWTPDTIPAGSTIINGKISGQIKFKISDQTSTVPFLIIYLFTPVNDFPIVSYIPPFHIDRKQTVESSSFTVNASDQDQDSLIYTTNTSTIFFTGPNFIWKPLKLVSAEYIEFSVSDGKGGVTKLNTLGCQGVECRTWPSIVSVENVSGCENDENVVKECKVFIPEDIAVIKITGRRFGETKPMVRVGRRECIVEEGSYSFTSLSCRVPLYANEKINNIPIFITRTDHYAGDSSPIYIGLSYTGNYAPEIYSGTIFNDKENVRSFLLSNEGYYVVPVSGERLYYSCICNAYILKGNGKVDKSKLKGTGMLRFKNSDIGDCLLGSSTIIDTLLSLEVCCTNNHYTLCSSNDSYYFKLQNPKILIDTSKYGHNELYSQGHSHGGYYIPIILSDLHKSNCIDDRILIQVNSKTVQLRDLCLTYKSNILIPSSTNPNMRDDFLRLSINNGYSWTRDNDSIPFRFTGYCKLGQYINNQWCQDCDLGYYCNRIFTRFSVILKPIPCSLGYYQSDTNQAQCKICPLGYQCFCKGMKAAELCDAGFICDLEGTIKRWRPCIGGFSCKEGMYRTIKNKLNYGENALTDHPVACPENTYCLPGVYTLIQDNNKYTPQTCFSFCPPGSDNPIGVPDCDSGQFCPNSKTCNNSLDYMRPDKKHPNCKCSKLRCDCSKGYFCGEKQFFPTPCEKGTYQPNTGQSVCIDCPPGSYCPWEEQVGPHEAKLCDPGYYCKINSNKQIPCEQGKYQDKRGQTDCLACPVGFFCDSPNMANPNICNAGGICLETSMTTSKDCPEKYYCEEGTNIIPNYTDEDANKIHPYTPKPPIICPQGNYCPTKSPKPIPCSLGTFNTKTGQTVCERCLPGFLCLITGVSDPTPCPAGYFCVDNQKKPCPAGRYCPLGTQTDLDTGSFEKRPILCPEGTYCVGGNTQAKPDKQIGSAAANCSQGYYNNEKGKSSCKPCPGGYECVDEGTITPSKCKPGTYRVENSTSIECLDCPEGTYNPEEGADTVDYCLPCSAGFVCTKVGVSELIIGVNYELCPAGFYCLAGTPRARKTQNRCAAGIYCTKGTDSEETARKNECPQGRYCAEGTPADEEDIQICSNIPLNCDETHSEECKKSIITCTIGVICAVDFYCPQGISNSIECPPGTISDAGSFQIQDCYRDPKTFYDVNILKRANAMPTVRMEPLTFNRYDLSFLSVYSAARMPEDFQLVISIVYDDAKLRKLETSSTRVLIISDQEFGTKQSIPLVLKQKSILSPKLQLSLNIMSNLPATINFELEYLEGNVDWNLAMKDSDLMEQTGSFTSKLGFLCVLTRDIGEIFEDPINIYRIYALDDDSRLETDEMKLENYFTISIDYQEEEESDIETSFYDKGLWDTVPEDADYFSTTYIPYITDCVVGYGAFVPINALLKDKSCKINEDPNIIEMYDWDVSSDGIYCDFTLICDFNLDIILLDRKLRWYETTTEELNSRTPEEDLPPFYITKKQLTHDQIISYINASPDFDLELTPVYVTKLLDEEAWREGDVPDNVNLKLKYYQRSEEEIEIITADLVLSNFRQASERSNTLFELKVNIEHLTWWECLDSLVYSRDQYVELMFTLSLSSMCIVTGFVLVSLAMKPQKIIPRFIGAVINQTVNSIIGMVLGSVPVLTTAYIMWVILEEGKLFTYEVGNFTDKVPIKGAYDEKAIDYRAGRFGICLVIIGLHAMRCSASLFIPLRTDNSYSYKEELERFRQQDYLSKTQGPFMANIILTLLYSVVIDSIGDFPTFTEYPYLYILPITAINYGISLMSLWLLRNEISIVTTKFGTNIALFSMILNGKKMSSVMFSYGVIITIRFLKQAYFEKYNNYLILNPITKRLDRLLEPLEHLGTQKRICTQQLRELADKSISIATSWFYAMYLVFIWLFYEFMNYNMKRECYFHLMIFFIFSLAWEPVLQFCLYWIRQTRDSEFKISRVLNQAQEHYSERTTQWALSNSKLNNDRVKFSLQVKDLFIAAFSTQYYTALFIVSSGFLCTIVGVKLFQMKSYSPFQDYYFFPIMSISNI